VVGKSQSLEAQAGGLLGQFLRMRRPVEEGKVGMAVQLGVGHLAHMATTIRRLIRLAFS
jgi:hypothetical protein